MDFEDRLEQAIARGSRARVTRTQQQAATALSAEEYKRLYTQYRLEFSDCIEQCLRKMADHMPGFVVQNMVSDGWGAGIRRDDLSVGAGRARENLFSRLEIMVRPFNSYHVLDLSAKGTVRNKEVFQRDHYSKLDEVDPEVFRQLIQQWALEYAELYTAQV
ncbi:MAG: hypothetical protein K8T91_13600 [Planctomycetes bacterium]|nr:hypothetical protein [Planctomycetota bacterium]